MPQHPAQRAGVAGRKSVEKRAGGTEQMTLFFLRRMPQQAGRQHGREGQRHDGRNDNGHRQGDGEFAEQPPHHIAHEQQRNEHGDEREGEGDDGEADLPRALERGGERPLAGFDVARDVFDHHDGVVHHEAGGDGQRHEGEGVDRKAEQIHRAESAHQRQRHCGSRNEGGAHAAQEHEDHQHHQQHGQQQLELHVGNGRADGHGAVGQHRELRGGGKLRLQAGQQLVNRIDHGDDIGARLALHVDHNAGLAVDQRGLPGVFGARADGGHVAQPHRRAAGVGDDHVAVLLRRLQLVVGVDAERLLAAADAALGAVDVRPGNRGANAVERQPQRGQRRAVDRHANGGFMSARERDQAHARHLRELLAQARIGQVVQGGERQRG